MMNIELYNKDCIEVLKSLDKDSVTMILSDIPYNEVNRKSSGLRNLDKDKADVFDVDLKEMVSECIRVCSGSFYIFCGISQISPLRNYFTEKGFNIRLGVWTKSNPSPMNGTKIWLSGNEFCIYCKKPKATFNEHCKKALWETPSGRSKVHPTEKPLVLFERLIKASTNEGDTVLDFTMGGGTTGVACKKLNRNFIGVELDETYFKIAKERIESTPDTK